jgi:UDP-N-acetylglucosamine--N-acetylmuramyl-(pentapeptide) pyrophosphoryl-undecaprenol N-acetylglucosamine transferase
MRKIFLTGGGSVQHVTPNIALIEHLRRNKWAVGYLGTAEGIERTLIEKLSIPYYEISTGKFPRHFDWKNFLDPFLVVLGIVQTFILCKLYKPDVIFSKGGFVAIPVVIGAWICRIPVICHEADIKPGVTSRICFLFARYVCTNYPQTERYLPRRLAGKRSKLTGSPIRQSILKGNASKGRAILGFTADKPVLLIFGDSPDSRTINDCIRRSRFQLLRYYQVIHVVGKGIVTSKDTGKEAYIQREMLNEEFGDILAAADLVISRADANSIYEFLAMRKSHLLIPLSRKASRGEQVTIAAVFKKVGMSMVLPDVELTPENLIKSLNHLKRQRNARLVALKKFKALNAVKNIANLAARTIQ